MEAVKAERERRTLAAAAAAANGARRRPLAPSDEKNNAAPAAGRRRNEGPSRFKPVVAAPAPTPAPPSPAATTRRCSSPSPGGRASAADVSAATCSNRARSADRARPSPSPSPAPSKPPSTAARPSASAVAPPRDAASGGDGRGSTPPRARNGKKASSGDNLWASASAAAARSSSPRLRPRPEPVVPSSSPATAIASKVDRLVQGLPCSSEQAKLRPSAGAVAAADRKRSPRRASTNNNTGDQCENARPSESPAAIASPNSVLCQHRWPGMMTTTTTTGRGSPGLTTSTPAATAPAPAEKKIVHRRRKIKADSSSDDTSSQTSESSKSTYRRHNQAISSPPVPVLRRSSSSPRQGLLSAASSSSASRSCCQSPSRMRPSALASAPCQSRCASPLAAHSAVEQSVFSYIVVDDARKAKKSAGQIENIHQLRLLSCRYLQWRFVNAHSEETLSRKSSVESILYSVCESILTLRDALTVTRTNVRHLLQELKLHRILTEQIGYLEQWPVLEEEFNDTLAEATEALKASTLRLPVTSGAHDILTLHEQADEIAVRNAISSAVDVMQALSSSIDYVQPKVKDRTSLVSELSVMARQENVALDQCRELLATAAKLQVQESSLRMHLMQLRQRSAG